MVSRVSSDYRIISKIMCAKCLSVLVASLRAALLKVQTQEPFVPLAHLDTPSFSRFPVPS